MHRDSRVSIHIGNIAYQVIAWFVLKRSVQFHTTYLPDLCQTKRKLYLTKFLCLDAVVAVVVVALRQLHFWSHPVLTTLDCNFQGLAEACPQILFDQNLAPFLGRFEADFFLCCFRQKMSLWRQSSPYVQHSLQGLFHFWADLKIFGKSSNIFGSRPGIWSGGWTLGVISNLPCKETQYAKILFFCLNL